jgi:hypothetical protein
VPDANKTTRRWRRRQRKRMRTTTTTRRFFFFFCHGTTKAPHPVTLGFSINDDAQSQVGVAEIFSSRWSNNAELGAAWGGDDDDDYGSDAFPAVCQKNRETRVGGSE